MTTTSPILPRAACGALLLALAACKPPPVTEVPVEIAEFKASPNPAAAGADVTLSWRLTGDVAGVTLRHGAETLTTGTTAEGSFIVRAVPAGDTRYTLSATGGGAARSAEVVVTGLGAPTISRFAPDRGAVPPGAAVVLSWRTALATGVRVTAGGAELGAAQGDQAAAGALVVHPTANTEYTLEATGIGGTATASTAVVLLAAPTITEASAAPAQLTEGASSVLAWKTENATALTIRAGGRVLYSAAAADVQAGSHTVTPALTTTYVLAAEGAGGTATRELVVEVTGLARALAFASSPRDVVAGGSVELAWSFSGVQTVALTADGAPVALPDGGNGPQGSFTVTPTQTTVYRVTGTGPGGEAFAELVVHVHGVPQIDSFVGDRTQVYRRGEPATLSWATRNATQLSITNAQGGVVSTAGKPLAAGSVQVSPLVSTHYVLTIAGPGGVAHSEPVALEVLEPPPHVTLATNRTAMPTGEEAELSWVIHDATDFALYESVEGGAPTAVDISGRATEDVLTVSPEGNVVYTLEAAGPGGTSSASVSITVARPPKFLYARSPRTTVTRGSYVTIEWDAAYTDKVLQITPTPVAADSPDYESISGMTDSVEITMDGTADSGTREVVFPAGFKFPFYGTSHTAARMCTDGYVCFGGTSQCSATSVYTNTELPKSSLPNNMIAAFWDDLETLEGVRYFWRLDGTAPNRRFVFEWKDAEFWDSSYDGANLNFQIVLFENGDWEIRHAPRELPSANPGSNARWGTGATLGAEGPGGIEGVQFSRDDAKASLFCRIYVPGSGTTFGTCGAPITRVKIAPPLAPSGTASIFLPNTGSDSASVVLKAIGPMGTAEATIPFTLVNPPIAEKLVASRAWIGAGEPVQFNWKAGPGHADLTHVRLSDGVTDYVDLDAAELAATPAPQLQGTFTLNPTETRTYTLAVTNTGGDVDTRTVTVKVEKPAATLTVDKPEVPNGDLVTFSWTSSAGQSLVLKGPDGNPVPGSIAFPLVYPDHELAMKSGLISLFASQAGTYRLEVTNGSGTTTVEVGLTIVTELRVVSFTASKTEQTAGEKVTLSWETMNSDTLAVQIDGTTDLVPLPGQADPSYRRRNSAEATVRGTDTTFRLVATKNGDPPVVVERTVLVGAVPRPGIASFVAAPSSILWNESTTLSWTVTDAVGVKLTERESVTDGSSDLAEIPAARDQLVGTYTVKLGRSTGYRLRATNRMGHSTATELNVNVTASSPTAILNVTPAVVPASGLVNLSWSSTTTDKVYLWRREPPTADSASDLVQIPYDYKPYGFVDISADGTELVPLSSSGSTDYNSGYAFVDFPADFAPEFMGDVAGKMLVTANGTIMLAPAGTANSNQLFYCGGTTTTSVCSPSTSTTNNYDRLIASTSTSTQRNLLAVLWADLSACNYQSTPSGCATAGRTPGRIFWKLVGAAPNRRLIVQWDDWDVYASGMPSRLTFEAMIYENGDVEYQYKRLLTPKGNWPTATSTTPDARVGIDKRFAGRAGNYFLQIPMDPLRVGRASVVPGDGWRIYSGAQAPVGSARSYVNQFRAGPPRTVQFRASAVNASTYFQTAKTVNVVAGVDDVAVSEMMITPGTADDTGKQWLELRNLTTAPLSLEGFTVQTLGGSYTFTSNDPLVPQGPEGYLVVAQPLATMPEGIAVVRLPDWGAAPLLSKPADEILLRFGPNIIDRLTYDAASGTALPSALSYELDKGLDKGLVASLNDEDTFWCAHRAAGTGTPGATNGDCFYFQSIDPDESYKLVDGLTDGVADADATPVPGLEASGTSSGDATVSNIPIGFAFPHFGRYYTTMEVANDGWLAFGGKTGTAYSNQTLPYSGSYGGLEGVYPFWDDLYRKSAVPKSGVWKRLTGTAPNRVLTVYWDNFNIGSSSSTNASFAVVLKENGTIEFHYYNLVGTNGRGQSATIGVEAMNDSFAVQYSYNAATLPVVTPTAPFAIRLMRAP